MSYILLFPWPKGYNGLPVKLNTIAKATIYFPQPDGNALLMKASTIPWRNQASVQVEASLLLTGIHGAGKYFICY